MTYTVVLIPEEDETGRYVAYTRAARLRDVWRLRADIGKPGEYATILPRGRVLPQSVRYQSPMWRPVK